MIIILRNGCNTQEINEIKKKVKNLGYTPHVIKGVIQTVIGAVGSAKNKERLKSLTSLPTVDKVLPVMAPYKLASRVTKKENTVIRIHDIEIGSDNFVIMAGPCSVETEEQTMAAARAVKKYGGHILRGGAYKPRTSPYSFQGLEEDGLKILQKAKNETSLPFVTELISAHTAELVASYADIIQIGARNMQNFALLKEAGKVKKPVLLKRGMAATLEELLMSAEYIMSEGNYNVILWAAE